MVIEDQKSIADAIILDVMLPGMDGYDILKSYLSQNESVLLC